ncbi:MAG: response regulator [Candidatus Berkelbacteria bacterium]|nr:response regulator [Candidatus Berkelbacteria bacterium]
MSLTDQQIAIDGNGRKVLVVDCEPCFVRIVEASLTRCSFAVFKAYSKSEALEEIERQALEMPEIVIVGDLTVEDPNSNESNFGLLRTLQENPKTKDIRVIMLTKKAEDKFMFRGWSEGVSSYLTRPHNPRELLIYCYRILEQKDKDAADPGKTEREKIWDVK